MSLVRGLITLSLLVLFVLLILWAWSSRRKPTFDAMARLPLAEDTEATPPQAPRSKP